MNNEKISKRFEIVKIDMEIKLSTEDIDDIMCSALEGGINYWCDSADVQGEYLAEYASEQISRGGQLILHDSEEDKNYILTKENFLRGIKMYAEKYQNNSIFDIVDEEIRIDCGKVDTKVADCIIQYALFGDVIYG